jgi:hypothetical protein
MEEIIHNWLKRKIAQHTFSCWAGSVLALAAGLVALFLTFWFTYVVIFIAQDGISAITDLCFNTKFHINHFWRLILSGLFVAGLFYEWYRRRNAEPADYKGVNSPPGARGLVLWGGMGGALGMLLANPQASSSMIVEILCTGPRLVIGAVSMAQAALDRDFDLNGCTHVLQLLMSNASAVTYEELSMTKSEFELTKLHNNLAQISGVVFLERGLGLTEDLRGELRSLMLQN